MATNYTKYSAMVIERAEGFLRSGQTPTPSLMRALRDVAWECEVTEMRNRARELASRLTK